MGFSYDLYSTLIQPMIAQWSLLLIYKASETMTHENVTQFIQYWVFSRPRRMLKQQHSTRTLATDLANNMKYYNGAIYNCKIVE